MSDDPLHRLPHQVTIDLEEIRELVGGLERLHQALAVLGATAEAASLDCLIAQVVRWLWPILDDLDEGEA